MLIVPIEHAPSAAAFSPSASNELFKYQSSLRKCYKEKLNGKELICFERHLALKTKGGNHAHVNCVPVTSLAAANAKQVFEAHAERHGFTFEVIPPQDAEGATAALKAVVGWDEYFSATLPDGTVLVHYIKRGEKHPMNFGREVVAELLGNPSLADWKKCVAEGGQAEETERIERFKELFKEYDIMG